MKKLYGAILGICMTTAAHADVPVYRNQTLSIQQALVITESGPSYYADIRLVANPDGSFKLVQAQPLEPAHVDSVAVEVIGPDPVEVNVEVSGYLPDPCHRRRREFCRERTHQGAACEQTDGVACDR